MHALPPTAMASSPLPSLALLLLLVFSTRASRAARAGADAVECERLDAGRCAFAVSSDGARCVLEIRSGGAGYACAASEIGAAAFAGLVETDECIAACGLDRRTVGVSSDALLDDGAVRGLCSTECLTECPNIVHLFSNLAAGEGTRGLEKRTNSRCRPRSFTFVK